MRKLMVVLVAVLFMCAFAHAQSSGNFSARVATAQCLMNTDTGVISGGLSGTVLSTKIKTPNSSSTALLIRPSLFTGLYTRTKVTDAIETATSVAGVKVKVQMCDENGDNCVAVAPDTGGGVFYDRRFQQLSSNVPRFIAELCTRVGITCTNPYIQLILSTMQAHSADFVIGDVGGGTHTLKVLWSFETAGLTGDAAACVGPGVLTVTQVKTFSTGSGIDITTNNP